MADEQQINSVSRFRKRSGRLVLEEYSHCEVPAGCGGVVLRWRNPQAGRLVTIYLYTPKEAACFLDGTKLETGRVDLTPGPHGLAVFLKDFKPSAGLIMFAAVHDPMGSPEDQASGVTEYALKVLSADDGTWKFTLEPPATGDWTTAAFDDRAWPALVKVPTPRSDPTDFSLFQCRQCAELGAACLGLPPAPGASGTEKPQSWWRKLLGRQRNWQGVPTVAGIWIRKVFQVPAALDPDLPS
jgi:hypothetical protein